MRFLKNYLIHLKPSSSKCCRASLAISIGIVKVATLVAFPRNDGSFGMVEPFHFVSSFQLLWLRVARLAKCRSLP